jgi:hypothetical protein
MIATLSLSPLIQKWYQLEYLFTLRLSFVSCCFRSRIFPLKVAVHIQQDFERIACTHAREVFLTAREHCLELFRAVIARILKPESLDQSLECTLRAYRHEFVQVLVCHERESKLGTAPHNTRNATLEKRLRAFFPHCTQRVSICTRLST